LNEQDLQRSAALYRLYLDRFFPDLYKGGAQHEQAGFGSAWLSGTPCPEKANGALARRQAGIETVMCHLAPASRAALATYEIDESPFAFYCGLKQRN
jgi:hypothetical protein